MVGIFLDNSMSRVYLVFTTIVSNALLQRNKINNRLGIMPFIPARQQK